MDAIKNARTAAHKARRIAKEQSRQSACKAVRMAFVKTKEVPRLKDISRRVRKAA